MPLNNNQDSRNRLVGKKPYPIQKHTEQLPDPTGAEPLVNENLSAPGPHYRKALLFAGLAIAGSVIINSFAPHAAKDAQYLLGERNLFPFIASLPNALVAARTFWELLKDVCTEKPADLGSIMVPIGVVLANVVATDNVYRTFGGTAH